MAHRHSPAATVERVVKILSIRGMTYGYNLSIGMRVKDLRRPGSGRRKSLRLDHQHPISLVHLPSRVDPMGLKDARRLQPECHIHALMFEGRSTSVQLCAAQPLAAQFITPVFADTLRHVPSQDPGLLLIDIEERRKTPEVLPCIDKTVVLQVVIRVGDKDAEHHPEPDFPQVLPGSGRDCTDDVGNVGVIP